MQEVDEDWPPVHRQWSAHPIEEHQGEVVLARKELWSHPTPLKMAAIHLLLKSDVEQEAYWNQKDQASCSRCRHRRPEVDEKVIEAGIAPACLLRRLIPALGRPPQARTNPFERFVRPAANQRINYNHHHPFCFCFRFLEIKVEKCCSKNLPPYFFSLHLFFGTSRKKLNTCIFLEVRIRCWLSFLSFFLSFSLSVSFSINYFRPRFVLLRFLQIGIN